MDAGVLRSWDRLFIGDEWVSPSTDRTIEVVSPETGEVVAHAPESVDADIDRAVAAARDAFVSGVWVRQSINERIAVLGRLRDLYAAASETMAELITGEMGSPIAFSRSAQVGSALGSLDSAIAVAESYPWEEQRKGRRGDVVVRREPVGVVAAIVPWNVPQFITMNKVAPALLAGCSVVLKPSPEAPLDALLLAELVEQAGLPAGVFNVVPAHREASARLVAHPDVDKVSMTGSTAAGRTIAAVCGQQLKRCSLELGGKSAAIVLDDADLDLVASGLRHGSFLNSGQACVAQTRVLVSRSNHDAAVDALAAMVRDLHVGSPRDPATEIGPLVARRQQERVKGYISLGAEEGASLVVGGVGMPDGLDQGWYVEPTLFAGASNDMRIAREEIFGPVLTVIPYDDVDDAVRIANDSDYGLAGSVWTADVPAGLDVARRVRTGTYGVNRYSMDLGAPFGGFKQSGLGRELGPEGMTAFVEYKSIVV